MDTNAKAQVAFRDMIDAKVYGDPEAPETRRYVAAEREMDHEEARSVGACECDDCAERRAAFWARSA